MKDVFDRGNVLAGVRVRTTDGRDLGKFEAFYFDEKSGRILGYELSGGSGRKKRSRSFLPTPSSFEAGKDVAFVSPETADTVQDLEEALKQSWQPRRVRAKRRSQPGPRGRVFASFGRVWGQHGDKLATRERAERDANAPERPMVRVGHGSLEKPRITGLCF